MTVLEALGEPADVLVCADFETYYDKKTFSLSKSTVEQYVRSDAFQVIGVGLKVGNAPAVWLEDWQFREWAAQVDWSHVAVLAHNCQFDGAILAWRYGIRPALWADSLGMARAVHGIEVGGSLSKLAKHYGLGEKGDEVDKTSGKRREDFTQEEWKRYGRYCCNDVELTVPLFWKLVEETPEQELWVIDTTLRCFTEPTFLLDSELMQASLAEEKERKAALLARIGADRASLMSNPKFALMLIDLGVEPPLKISPRTGKETFAFARTDPGMRDLIEHERDEVRWLAEARIGVKSTIVESRTERFLKIAERGPLPVPLNYCGARTGRWSGAGRVNLQNLNRGGVLRDALLAPPGQALVVSDSMQIEARFLAWFAQHQRLVQAFAQGRDIYSEFASKAYRRKIDRKRKLPDGTKPDEKEGNVGKTCSLGLGYSMSWAKLATSMLAGPMGAPPIQFTEDDAKALDVDVRQFVKEHGRRVRKIPTRLSFDAMAVHCAVCKALVDFYRNENPEIPQLWRDMDEIIAAMSKGLEVSFGPNGICRTVKNGIVLPTGRRLRYPELRFDEDGFSYKSGRSKKDRTNLYGGKLVENIVQALSRDIVAEQMLWVRASGYHVVTTTHDEIVARVSVEQAEAATADVVRLMSIPPAWAQGVPLAAEGGFGTSYGAAK